MLANRADVNSIGGQYYTALHAAAFAGSQQVVDLLLMNGATLDIQGDGVGTVLQAAVSGEHEGLVRQFLQAGLGDAEANYSM